MFIRSITSDVHETGHSVIIVSQKTVSCIIYISELCVKAIIIIIKPIKMDFKL